MKIEFISAAVVVILFIAAIAIPTSDDQPQQTQNIYCEMVDIHKDTGGEYGWPDYNQNYDEVCR